MSLIIYNIYNPPYLLAISWDGLWFEMIDRVDFFILFLCADFLLYYLYYII